MMSYQYSLTKAILVPIIGIVGGLLMSASNAEPDNTTIAADSLKEGQSFQFVNLPSTHPAPGEGFMRVAHFDDVHAYAFSPDDKTALSGNNDGSMKWWDLSTGHVIKKLQGILNIVLMPLLFLLMAKPSCRAVGIKR
jgi:WD40 repeat protein